MSRKRQKQTACRNHRKLSPAEQESESLKYAQMLCDGLNFAIQSTQYSNPEMNQILARGEVYPGVEGLEMDVAVIGFPNTNTDGGHTLGYTWEFLEGNSVEEISQMIIEQVYEAQEEGAIPRLTDQGESQ